MLSFRYRDKNTAIHRLSPFSKLGWVAGIFVLSLVFSNPLYLSLLFIATLPFVAAARIWREWAMLMKFSLYLCLAVILINALVSYQGAHILWQAGFHLPVLGTPVVTLEAIAFGVGMSLRLLAIISALAILTLTTHPDDMMLAMIKLKLPYKSVLVTSLATRFVPALIDDGERISAVQRSRGVELGSGNLIKRVRSFGGILMPLLSNSLDRTVQVAEAMESRAFGSPAKRTFFRNIRLSRLEWMAIVLSFLPLVLGVVLRLQGWGNYRYYPTLGNITISVEEGLILLLLLLLLWLVLPVAIGKQRWELD